MLNFSGTIYFIFFPFHLYKVNSFHGFYLQCVNALIQPDPSIVVLASEPARIQNDLSAATLQALGQSASTSSISAPPVHPEIAAQWSSVILQGLSEDTKKELAAKYPLAPNLKAAQAPLLNKEIKAAVSQMNVDRDIRVATVQNQTGSALLALGKAQSQLLDLQEEGGGEDLLPVIEAVNDAARLVADVHHHQSVTRQNIVSVSLDKNIKELIEDTTLDGGLFGANLGDRFKASKAIQKSGAELRKAAAKPTVRSDPKNFQSPSRTPAPRGGVRKFRQNLPKIRPVQVRSLAPQSRGRRVRDTRTGRYH